jgi:hypothetical protein
MLTVGQRLGIFFRDDFLNYALVDATYIYGWYGIKQWASADYIMLEDVSVPELLREH